MEKLLDSEKKSKGLTLIEMLAAVTIFVIAVVAVSGIIISGIRSQRRVLATQEILDQASYVMEYMGRTLRMAKKELNCPGPQCCLTTSGNGYNYEGSGDNITFIDYQDNCTEFFLDTTMGTGQLKKKDIMSGIISELTSPKITVNSFLVDISGEAQPLTDFLQPRVTLFLELLGRESMGQPKIQIQTSISQRALDVEYVP